ncbi:discoidin domain-containing protein [Streptomyces sp. Amel2xC10]|uniref:discoidin domain-containing protein n=1 Tax=Streptomyces sp. Amel2xC10 TaxID=1305826 RepID=UPI000A08A928|nr:discoidin domain-containing protein [Streptomyces sp. Amel2xC10]SMF37279.1 DNA-directed RNA polymerase specialized sigma subunit, sigma24 family [Streptomyces sp. Amel2xC10]
MSEPDNSDPPTAGPRLEETLSEADVVERIRGRAAVATPATQEFRRRHLPAVLAYARVCSRQAEGAAELADRAFASAVREIRRGIDAPGTWRHRLLILVQRTAVSWSADGRRERLAPGFVACVEAADGPDHAGPLPVGIRSRDAALLDGFHDLPERTCGVLWHAVIEAEPDSEVAARVGVETEALAALKASAHTSLQRAYLRAHLERNGSATCGHFHRLIEAATEPGDLRRSVDLEQHMSECSCCTLAVAQLFRLKQDPRGALADGLLGWGSAAYLATAPTHTRTRPEPPRPAATSVVPPRPAHRPEVPLGSTDAPPHQPGGRALGAAAVAVAVVAVAVVVLLPDDRPHSGPVARPPQPPGLTAPVTWSPSAAATSASPGPSASASPAPTPKQAHRRTHAASPSPVPSPRGDVNLALHKPVVAGSHTQDYVPSNASDGDSNTYWEATSNLFPQSFQIDLGSPVDIRTIAMDLPPVAYWNQRSQTISVEGSTDGSDWTTLAPATSYFFDATQGNTATATLASAPRTRYVRLLFTANSGWPAAQLSELRIFAR